MIICYPGKCELFHWIDILDLCDEILEAATLRVPDSWVLACDQPGPEAKRSKGRIDRASLSSLHLTHCLQSWCCGPSTSPRS